VFSDNVARRIIFISLLHNYQHINYNSSFLLKMDGQMNISRNKY